LEQAPDAFVSTDSEGVITEWNVRAERTFGWSRQEALGRNIAELLVPERLRSEHVAGMRQFALSGSGPIIGNRLRVPAKHRDGREIPVELSVSAVRTGEHYSATAFLHDISALIAHEEQIAASEKRARTIADAMPALIAYIDREQRFAFTNRRYGQVLGVDPATMLGKTIAEVEGEAAYAQLREQVEAALAGRKVHFEREGEGGDQPAHYMIDFIPDVTADGAVAGFYAMVLDISERKSAELKQAESERRADAASRAKSEFVANMSHEIRTPMNAVLGIAQLLERTDLSAEQRKYLDMIRASGSALLGILNDILDFSKVEAGRIELAPTPFALSTVLDALATIMTLNAGDKDLELAIGVEPDVPPGLHGDAMRLQQVLVNLVGNAVKFTERGEVSLLVELLRREGDEVLLRFVVRDTGIGIAPEQQLQIFSPFSQADASTSRRFGGTGLGLAITRRLVELMGGQLGLESTPGEGSEFSVTLPLGVSNEAGGARPQPARLGALRILVVDDNRTSADYLGKILASWKWQSDTVHSGERALAAAHALAAQGARYDVVLVDWQMEGMGGTDTVAALRALASVQAPPCVIMVSAFGRERVAAADGAQRPDAILLKPVTASSLFDTVQEALAGSGGAARRSPVAASFLAASPIRGRRLLLVEDNELNQVVARGMLEPAGASVFVAENGALAVDVLRAGRQPFDLVLMDVQMPVMDGFEAARIIRKELGLTLPIVAMTAGVTMAEQEQCRASGMDGFVPKPVDMDQMIATIAQHLAPRAPAADAAPAAAPTPAHRPAAAAAPAERDGVFDPSALLRIGAGEPTQRRLLDALVSNMATRIPLLLAKADAARAGGRHEELASLMHGLRGSVGSVGAQRFVVAAQALEDALRQRRSGEVDAL
ncbi:MAG TPA: response regulator, partial [Telluria sp.]|nr:response regulator [Telluria sp.]